MVVVVLITGEGVSSATTYVLEKLDAVQIPTTDKKTWFMNSIPPPLLDIVAD